MQSSDFLPFSAAIICALAHLLACEPQIGDECELSTDCSATGDRLCDTTQPGGYCTVFNCEPGTCPEDSVCIGFGSVLSVAKGCRDRQGGSRLQRTFCMRRCDEGDDCRSGYDCIDVGVKNPWGAIVLEYGPTNGKVCAVPFKAKPVDDAPADLPGVCTGYDGGFDARPTLNDAGPADTPNADAADAGDVANGDAVNDATPLGDAEPDAGTD